MTATVDGGSSLPTPQRSTVGEVSARSEAAQQKTADEEATAPVYIAENEQADSDPAHLRAQIQALRADLAATTLQRDQLAASLTLTHTAIERMADAAYWVQLDGRLIYANEAACRELGYRREELLALSIPDLVPDYTAEMWAAHWAELGRAGTLRFDGLHRRKDGSLFPVEVSTSLIQAGSTHYACGIVRNMSIRVEAERALADSEAKFAAAFGLSPIAMS
ncbi:MAG: PAS domain S-box protein, partial [Caldilineaceae bacterium]|nr:PAS domain S-box protein [Caldilineaceae bacterium]